jgi:RNA polymerase sigma factor (sigma-70 family)
MNDGRKLLAEYAETGSEAAFQQVVTRYLNLVYSSAVRLVNGDTHLAQDVTQNVFADLARLARTLSKDVMLGGWLHRHTCFVANKTMRTERRRQARERHAMELNTTEDHAPANLALVAPILDEAINQLGSEDRQAILLRYFEQRDFRSVGEALGGTEEGARKRVHRALDKLHLLLKRRGVMLSATGLGAALGAQAVTAAPAGMAVTVTASALATAAASGTVSLTILQLITMTKLQTGIIGAIALVAAIPLAVQRQTQSQLREENASLRQEVAAIHALRAENSRLSNLVAQASKPAPPASEDQRHELMKLRGEVGVLRQQAATATSNPAAKATGPSALGDLTQNPEMAKLIRGQQKAGMTMIYKDFATRANLSKEQTEKLNDLLADNVMTNIEHITAVMRDGKSPAEMDQLFRQEDLALQDKVKNLLGEDAAAQYRDYTRNLASYLTSEQFKPMLGGDKAAKDDHAKLIYQAMQEEAQQAVSNAGLDPDYQLVPSMNFRNFASEQEGEKNLNLLDSVYDRVAARASSFLTPDEVQKFGDFRKLAINNNRAALAINRKMMAPGSK